MKRLLFIFLLNALCLLGYGATTFYVSYSTGNDANTAAQAQSINTPWKTLDKVLASINNNSIPASAVILLKRGDAWLAPRNWGMTKALVYDAYGPGTIKPFVTGLLNVPQNGWTVINPTLGIWETTDTIVNPLSNSLQLVVINGKNYAMGRTPNGTATNKGWLNYEAHTTTSITDNQNPFTNSYAGASIAVRTTHTNIDVGTISSVSGNVININTAGMNNSLDANNGWGYFVQNDIKCLDQFGEWFYNTTTKKISLCVGPLGNPSAITVQYPYLDTMVQPKASNIEFRNIQFDGVNRYICYNNWTGLNNIWFRGCDFSHSGGDFVNLMGKTYSGIDNFTASQANSNAFSFGNADNSIYVTNGTIRDIGLFPGMLWKNSQNRYGHGIFFSGQTNQTDTGLTARNLNILNVGYSGIFLWSNNNTIEYNYIDTVCFVQDDGACIYSVNYTPTGSTPKIQVGNKFRYNILLHSIGAKEGTPGNNTNEAQGLYMDDNTNFALLQYNICAQNTSAGIYMHNTNRSRVEYNQLYDNKDEQLFMQDDGIGDSIYSDTIRYNVLFPTNVNQLCYYFGLSNSTKDSKTVATWGIFNFNRLEMPFSTNVGRVNIFGVSTNNYPLANWRSTYSYDVASTGIPAPVTSTDDIQLVYNTSINTTNSFLFPCASYISAEDTTYFNSVTLKPITGKILLLKH